MSTALDLKNKKFGRLKVLRRNGNIHKAAAWLCICDCGNEKTTTTSRLRTGSVKSCGCLLRESQENLSNFNRKKKTDLSGVRFGRLTAVKIASVSGNRTKWLCRCDCGNKTTTLRQSLLKGHTKSCGCLKKETNIENGRSKFIDITGKKYNRLTVIKRSQNSPYGSTLWLCRCECGRYSRVKKFQLQTGGTKSCGCYATDSQKKFMLSPEGTRCTAKAILSRNTSLNCDDIPESLITVQALRIEINRDLRKLNEKH